MDEKGPEVRALFEALDLTAIPASTVTRRKAIVAAMTGLHAEAAWQCAVNTAAQAMTTSPSKSSPLMPRECLQTLESGRAVVIPQWLSTREVAVLREDVLKCFREGQHFEKFVSYSRRQSSSKDCDPYMMKSFSPVTKQDGPFVDPTVGNFEARQNLKARMAEVKAWLATELQDRRPTLADNIHQTHEIEYLRYAAGGQLERHVDERHVELKRPMGSQLPKKPNATRRSVTWLIYLNDDDWLPLDGGHLRLHERVNPSASEVGSRGPDLQIGWLKAISPNQKDQPVFLDPFFGNRLTASNERESCVLYTMDDGTGTQRTNLSFKPFPNIALHLAGGDAMARSFMVDDPNVAKRLHLIDAPKSKLTGLVASSAGSNNVTSNTFTGEDGGERIRDVVPQAGTLVMFDSVSLPHQVMETHRERFAVQGWFHEKLYY